MRVALEVTRARDEERASLARELHDGAAQVVGAAKLEVERLALRYPAVPLAPVLERLEAAFADLRALAHALQPPALDSLGFRPALRRLADDLGRRGGARVTYVEHGTPRPLPGEVEWNLYRIAEEAIANAARHAAAHEVRLELAYADASVTLVVADDGRGFDLGPERARDGASGMGLQTIRERARALGGRFTLASRPGEGTRVEVAVPATAAPSISTGGRLS